MALAPVVQAEANNKPVLYITFDDGPSRDTITPRLLDVLESYDAVATFFVVGQNVRLNPSRLTEIYDRGHAVGNHTDSHSSLPAQDDDEVRRQLSSAQESVSRAGGSAMTCYRPPYGHTDDRIRRIGAEQNLVEELWDISVHDWNRDRTVDDFLMGLNRAQAGDVILLHDGWIGQEDTLVAVTRFLEERHDEFEFRALPSCVTPTPTTSSTTSSPTTAAPPTTGQSPQPLPPEPLPPSVPNPRPDAPSVPWRPVREPVDLGSSAQNVERLYQAVFARGADAQGRAFWIAYADQWSMEAVTDLFLASPEFNARYRVGSDDEFIDSLYQNTFGRLPDPEGKNFWLDQMKAGLGRQRIVAFFVDSPELKARLPNMRLSVELRAAIAARTSVAIPSSAAYTLWNAEREDGLDAAVDLIDSLLCTECAPGG